MSHPERSNRARCAGFTLVEVMIAVLILGVITSQAFVVFNTQKRVFSQSEKALDVQEDARLVVDLIGFDARQSGFMVPQIVSLASEDGGASDPDRFCVSDASYFDFPGPTDVSESLDSATGRIDRSAVTAITSGNVITVADLDIDDDNGAVDFQAGAGIILSDGTNSHCARIESVAGSNITVASGHDVPGGSFGVLTNVRAVPAIVYEVDKIAFTLSRNGLVLANGVEDLQVEYWVDTGPTQGVVDADEFPVDDLNNPGLLAMDTSAIRSARVTVITRAVAEEGGPLQKYDLNGRPAAGNRAAGAADSFRRRRFVASVTPRNLL